MAQLASKSTTEPVKLKQSSNPTKAAKPTRNIFDPWNSSATGHQRADNTLSGSTSWRDSRTAKLSEQFKDGQRGGKRQYDTVGAGSEDFSADGRLENGAWERGAKGLRKGGQSSLWESFDGAAKVTKPGSQEEAHDAKRRKLDETCTIDAPLKRGYLSTEGAGMDAALSPTKLPPNQQIFRDLVIYINGSTFPLISDHKLKRLLADHGARLSIALGRRTVTHVIIGTPNSNGGGAGGGLAGGKLQKEIATVRGKGVKFVSVEWVLESIKASKRLPEARFSCLKIAPKGQKSVLGMFGQG